MISCGYWDNSFKVLSVDSKQLLQSVNQHRGTVTCIAVGLDGTTLVTGSRDTTIMIWTLSGSTDRGNKAVPPVLLPPRLTLFGHDDEVSAVAVNCELDVVVSGGNDGSILLHTLRTGTFVWSANPVKGRVSTINISPVNGLITIYSQARFTLAVLSINGKILQSTSVHDRLSDMFISRDGQYLVTSGSNAVVFRTLPDLKFAHKVSTSHPVSCMCLSPDSMYILLSTKDGNIMAVGKNPGTVATAAATNNRFIDRLKVFGLLRSSSDQQQSQTPGLEYNNGDSTSDHATTTTTTAPSSTSTPVPAATAAAATAESSGTPSPPTIKPSATLAKISIDL